MAVTQAGRLPAKGRPDRPQVAAVMAVGCLIVVAFQAALALGAPLGAAAQGGANVGKLPDGPRVVAALFALAWLIITLIVLARGGFGARLLPSAVARWGAWILVSLFCVATLLNFASPSPWERFGWAPFSLAMLVLSIALARSGSASSR